jgi:hypothetical protein
MSILILLYVMFIYFQRREGGRKKKGERGREESIELSLVFSIRVVLKVVDYFRES